MRQAHHDKKNGRFFFPNTMQVGLLITFIPLLSPSVQLPLVGTDVCLYSDGTIVTEEYFHTLSDNSDLVLVPRGQTWSGGGKNTRIKNIRLSAHCSRFPNNTCAFKYQLCTTSDCYSARACTMSSSRRQKSCCLLMTTLIRSVKSCPTCCWTSRINLSWRTETMTRPGLKVLSSPDTRHTRDTYQWLSAVIDVREAQWK